MEKKTGGDVRQSISGGKQQDNSELVMGSDMSSKENRSVWSRVISFYTGFFVIMLIGIAILKKIDQNNKDVNSENSEE
ncbi:hypothetical protein [Methanosarcina horonobensis]|uniref:hypothetical protein n=1 Tax=Methanosarcina horonobensis TaxID=418008 RepID=UPI0022B8B974|nr:hypothetical protein [Methanosarcina horonobensis]